MAPSASRLRWKHDVFLSFCGRDTRRNFVSHLDRELRRLCIKVFKDDIELERGAHIDSRLLQAIRDSKFAIPVISKNYALSKSCLEELAEIIDCAEIIQDAGITRCTGSLTVIPIFYKVSPSDVGRQTGSFGEAFEVHQEDAPKVERWKRALTKVASIAGEDSEKWSDESKLTLDISRRIFRQLISMSLSDRSELVGMDACMEEIESLLSLGSDDEVRMIGICGMGGIGKTTLARYIFREHSSKFDAHYFIDDVEGIPGSYDPTSLQKHFLSRIFPERDQSTISSVEVSDVIRTMLGRLKVLIVLDNVNNLDQLTALAGEKGWFGRGSRIIVTSRTKNLLAECQVYKVKCLNKNDAIQLFSHFALKQKDREDHFLELSRCVVEYASGLPLALEFCGKYLGEMREERGETAWNELKRKLGKRIMEVQRMSTGKLDEQAKAIFLYVACFFNWTPIERAERILNVIYADAKHCIELLADNFLVELSKSGLITVHGLLQQMAKEIVDLQSYQPEKRRFLLNPKEIYDVLKDATGTGKIEGISLCMSEIKKLFLTDNAFKKMHNLRLLNFSGSDNANCSGVQADGLNRLPRKLVSIEWDHYPLNTLPQEYDPEYLVELRMRYSQITRLWDPKLVLDLSASNTLETIPDLSMAPHIEELDVSQCENLVNVSSIQNMQKLTRINLRGCRMLKHLPSCSEMESLRHFNLDGCTNLRTFPEVPPSIKTLQLRGTAIQIAPLSIKHIVSLVSLDMSYCPLITSIPSEIESLSELETLNLESCESLTDIPKKIQNMKSLKTLCLSHCKQLESLPELPKSLQCLVAHGCSSLAKISQLPILPAQHLVLGNCRELAASKELQQMTTTQFEYMGETFSALLPGCQIPRCFNYRSFQSSLNIPLPQNHFLMGFLACVVVATEDRYDAMALSILCEYHLRQDNWTTNLLNYSWPKPDQVCHNWHVETDHQFLFRCNLERPEACTRIKLEFRLKYIGSNPPPSLKLKECAVHLNFAGGQEEGESDALTAQSSSSYHRTDQVGALTYRNTDAENFRRDGLDQGPESKRMKLSKF